MTDPASSPDECLSPAGYWWLAARVPLLIFLIAGGTLAFSDIDVWIARTLFFAQGRWLGADSVWTGDIVHVAGGLLVRLALLAALAMWAGSFASSALRYWRRPAGYLLLAAGLSVGVVGLLKHVTNIDCPWDLVPFGGRFPYVHLFADRPDNLRRAACFPAAHASSGYAFMSLYFVALEHSRRWARRGLWLGIAIGLVFGISQQSRGAHFLSHDLWAAMLAWLISLSVYCFVFRCRILESDRCNDGAVAAGTAMRLRNMKVRTGRR
ncbi:MAG TPA: phosphatase PAP2 family protein [Povalibacter sp.]|nr:phosphatase PAP2 family protein [Povalibacter sp.]